MEPPPLPQASHVPKILTLPDELLLEIFSAVKSWRPANRARHVDYASSSRDIASVRLACRRFAAAAAHLLVHYVRLPGGLGGGGERSLQRLEAIARHPLVARGVRVVRLEATCYPSALASSFESFALHAIARALGGTLAYKQAFEEEEIGCAGAARENDDGVEEDLLLPMSGRRAEVGATLGKVKAVLKAWSSVTSDDRAGQLPPGSAGAGGEDPGFESLLDQDDEEMEHTERYTRLLRLAYERFCFRYREQESLRKNSTFIERFAAAMANMPKAKTLEILDFHRDPAPTARPSRLWGEGPSRNELAGLLDVESLTKPMPWADVLRRELGSPPSEVLFALPVALQQAGVKLHSISVQTSARAEHLYPVLRGAEDAGEYEGLGSAVRRMGVRSFSFVHGDAGEREPRRNAASSASAGGARKTPSPSDVAAFQRYIAAMASSDRLERLRVSVDGGWADGSLDPECAFSFGAMLAAPDVVPGADDNANEVRECQQWWERGRDLYRASASRRPNLVDVHLTNVPLRLSELEGLVARAKGEGEEAQETHGLDFLTLSRTHLVAGTWRRALGALRRLGVGEVELVEPLGAECDDPGMLSSGRYEAIFCTSPSARRRSVAERFVNRELEENPLLGSWLASSACDSTSAVQQEDEEVVEFAAVVDHGGHDYGEVWGREQVAQVV